MALDEDIEVVELLFVVEFLESVKFLVVGLTISVDLDVTVVPQLSLQRPLAIDKAHVAQVELVLLAHGAAKLRQLLLQLEDAIAAIDDKEL